MQFINLIFDHISQLLADSRTYRNEKRRCHNCDRLVHLLEVEKREKANLLDLLNRSFINPNESLPTQEGEEVLKPIQVGLSWNHKRYQLEQEAREKAKKFKEEMELTKQ